MTSEELKEISRKKFEEYEQANEAWKKSIIGDIEKQYKHHFIKYKWYETDEDWKYMLVNNIWSENGYEIYFEGAYMHSYFGEYVDNTNAYWTLWQQECFVLNDFEGTIYKNNLMHIIDKEEWNEAFNLIIKQATKENAEYIEYICNKNVK